MKLATLAVDLVLNKGSFDSGIKGARQSATGLEESLGKLSNASRRVFRATAGGFMHASKAFSSVEYQIAQTAANITQSEGPIEGMIETLNRKVKEVAETTLFLPEDVAEAMKKMSKAGFSFEEITANIAGVAKTAMATETGIAQVARRISQVMRQFNLTAEDASRVSNVLTLASKSAAHEFEDIAYGMSKAAPAAAKLGYSLEEVSSILTVFAQRGLMGGVGGRALQNILFRLIGFTSSSENMLRSLRIQVKDLETGNLRPLADIFEEISYRVRGLDEQQAIKALGKEFQLTADQATRLAKMFRLRGSPGAFGLVDPAGFKELRRLEDRFNKAGRAAPGQGLVDQQAEAMMNTLAGIQNRTVSTMKFAEKELIESIRKEYEVVLNGLQKVFAGVSNQSDSTKRAIALSYVAVMAGSGVLSNASGVYGLLKGGRGIGAGVGFGGEGGGGGGTSMLTIAGGQLVGQGIKKALMSGEALPVKIVAIAAVAVAGYSLGKYLYDNMRGDEIVDDLYLSYLEKKRDVLGLFGEKITPGEADYLRSFNRPGSTEEAAELGHYSMSNLKRIKDLMPDRAYYGETLPYFPPIRPSVENTKNKEQDRVVEELKRANRSLSEIAGSAEETEENTRNSTALGE